MDYRDEVAGKRRGIIDWMMKYIPGYRGYAEKETRREADKLLREHLAGRLKQGRERIKDVRDKLAEEAKLESLDDVDRVDLLYEGVTDRLGFASYGYAGFFDAVRVDEAALDKLYEFDEALAKAIDVILEKTEAVGAAANEGADVKGPLDELKAELRAFEGKLDQRQETILGVT
ncbi:MAG: hypothetical protein JSU81_06205 [Candidatus Coatesbacteria bacterium]|nr:MAG: hypothetical protein JSU81_06205 [Candidatus Coatesbacteria bacterium]